MKGDSKAETMEIDSGETFALDNRPSSTRDFLSAARRLVDQGQPSQALQAVVMAMRTQGGDEAVLYILNRTRELYKRRIQETTSIDQLASIFAQCAITEAEPLGHGPTSTTDLFGTKERVTADAHGISILEKSGRSQIMLDAFADGSSFICLKCGGLMVPMGQVSMRKLAAVGQKEWGSFGRAEKPSSVDCTVQMEIAKSMEALRVDQAQ